MLNRLKVEHEDENVYLSSIVDEAIRCYYGFIFSGNLGKETAAQEMNRDNVSNDSTTI
jgi:hypothetical protein